MPTPRDAATTAQNLEPRNTLRLRGGSLVTGVFASVSDIWVIKYPAYQAKAADRAV